MSYHTDQSIDPSTNSEVTTRERSTQDAAENNLMRGSSYLEAVSTVPVAPTQVNPSRVLVTGSNVTLYTGNPAFVVSPPEIGPGSGSIGHSTPASQSPQPGPLDASRPLHEEIGQQGSNRIYECHMLTRGRGYPLWLPEGDLNVSIEKRRLGVSIGDVGMVTSYGCFSYLFNILLPSDHPLQPEEMPEGYTPVSPLGPKSIMHAHEFKHNSALTSISVCKLETPSQNDTTYTTTEQMFELSSSEGAVLALPAGAESSNLREKVVHWRRYMRANLAQWYRYVVGTLGCEITNGDLRLVIGCDKTTFWGVAVAEHPSFSRDKCWLRFRPSELPSNSSEAYTWDYNGVVVPRTGPSRDEIRQLDWDSENHDSNPRNQCVFVRSLNMTLPADMWDSISEEFELEQDVGGSVHWSSPAQSSGHPTGSSSTSGYSKGKHRAEPSLQPKTNSLSTTFVQDEKPHQRLYTDYHPGDLVNQMLLALSPNAKAASCSDGDWCNPLLNNPPSKSSFDVADMLCTVFFGADIEEVEGIAQLKVKRTNDESSSIHIWRWLRSMRAKMEPNGDVKSLYKDEDHATDLLLVLNPLVKFLLGIQTLKDNDSKYLTLWDNSDYQNSHFFRETFRLLDPMLAPPLLSSSTELSVPLSPIFLLPSKYYRDFRRTGYVRDLQACANVLRRHVPMTKPVERYTGFESQSVLDRYARLQQEAANAGTSSVSGSSSILEVYPQLSRYKSTGADSEDYEPPEQRPVTFMPHNALVRDTLTATAPERRSTTSSIFTPSRYLAGDFGNHRVLHEPSLGVQAETQENTEITLPDIFIPSQIPPVWDPISAGKDLIPIPSPPWAGDEDILAKNKHRRYRPGVVLDMAEDLPEDQKMSSRGKERRRLHFHDRDSSTLARELEQTWSPRVSQADDSITTSMHVPSTSSSKKPCSSQPTILTDVTERFSLFE